MPIYEYECKQCGAVEEVFQKISENPLSECKKCSGKLHKLISHSSFHLKGSGWYVTDYARGNKQSADKSPAPAADGKTDTDKSAAPKPADQSAEKSTAPKKDD
jgi:putative FmdB family regulatory protein